MQEQHAKGAGTAAGDTVGSWTLLEPLGAGAFGTTWRARRVDGRIGALKVLDEPPRSELRALASVCHPAVVGVLDGGGDPVPYLVMDLAPGASLGAVLEREGPNPEAAPQLAAVLADALAAVHAVGVVHGDVKPDNVIVGTSGQAWLVDFGMAGRLGGTALYASPERVGTAATPPSDVYGLGLVLWELLHGELPWDGGWGDRGRAAPQPRIGPPWLRPLLARMLDPDPNRRPSASEVADTLAANGSVLPQVDAELLRRRAARSWVRRRGVDEAIAHWLDHGGTLALTGGPRVGKTHALARIAMELSARGEPWIWWTPGGRAWDAVRQALAEPRLGAPRPLPAESDPELLARLAAAEVEDRAGGRLFVLADDADTLDEGSRATLRLLAQRGRVHVCMADAEPPPWVEQVAVLEVLDEQGIGDLIGAVLGPMSETGPLVRTARDVSDGVPGRAVDLLCAALDAGALVRRAHRWLVDDARLAVVAAAGPPPAQVSFDAEVAALAAPLGLAGPLSFEALADLAGVDVPAVETGLQALASLGLVILEGRTARPAGRAATGTLAAQAREPAVIHRRILDWLLRSEATPAERLGWHLVGAGDPGLVARYGPAALMAAAELDPSDAARMGEELARIAPSAAIAAARVDALRAAGRIDAALSIGEQAIRDSIGASHWPVLVALGQLHGSLRDDPDAGLACFAKARQVAPAPVPIEIDRAEAVTLLRAGRVEEAAALAAETLEDIDEPTEPTALRHWIALHTTWAQAVDRIGGPAAALGVLERVRPGGTKEHALLESAKGMLLFKTGRLHDGARALEVASACLGLSAAVRARLLINAAGAQFHIGNLRSALSTFERAALLLERMEARSDLAATLSNMAVAYEQVGRGERALESARRAVDLALQVGATSIAASALGNLGDLWVNRGEHTAARESWSRARALAEEAGNASELVELERRVAELAAELQEPDALERARAAHRAATDAGNVIEACRAGALVALGEARAGRRRRVTLLLEQVTQPLQAAGASAALAEVRLHLASALTVLGDEDDARGQLERVLAYAEEVGSVRLRTRADALASMLSPRQRAADPRLDRLLDLAVEVARERHLPTLLDGVAAAALDLLGAERAFVLLVEASGAKVVASRSVDSSAGGPPSMTIVRRALSGRREVIAGDLGERGDLRNAASVVAMDLLSVLCVPMLDRGEAVGAIYVDSRTTTEHEWAEAARLLRALASQAAIAVANARFLAAARERAELAADIAHDLSGPAHVVLCIADEILDDGPEPEQIAHDLRRVGEHIVAMRDRFLRGISHEAKALSLDTWLDDLGPQLARVARRGGAVFEVQIETPGLMVQADAHELERALTNLVRNAVRFSPAGGRVLVRLRAAGTDAVIEVADDGPGIPSALVDTIFERGVQGRADDTGHGLGLSIARRIVDGHGGRLGCRNRPEGGATFTIALPAQR